MKTKISERAKKFLVVSITLFVVGMIAIILGTFLQQVLFVPVPVNGSSSENIVIGDNTAIFFKEPPSVGLSTYHNWVYDSGVGDVGIMLRGGRITTEGGNIHILYHNVSWTFIVTDGGYVLYITSVK